MYTDFFFKWQVIPVEILKTTKMCKKKKKILQYAKTQI